MAERETWTVEEFGAAHEGAIGVLLADGTVPQPVYFGLSSGPGGQSVSQWSVYDGRFARVPKAAALRGLCSCGWTGTEHPLDWDEIGERALWEGGDDAADASERDWFSHIDEVEESALPLPETLTELLTQVQQEIERLSKSSPLAALRAVRRLEVIAVEVGYWAAREARQDATSAQAAAALGLSEDTARELLARFGRWSPYG
ncbi:hypothetical protein [Streptomyces clavuligerus]|nr:hypothetical protein [Streptomyces clavuligerus]WDN56736.1 hypothetical protein LL058_33525 [Streptomyces clavuligerus]